MKTLLALNGREGLDCPVKLQQATNGKLTVTYGLSVKGTLRYADAAREFGEAVFHSLSCAGKLDNSKEDTPAMYKAPDVDPRGGWRGEKL